MLFLGPPFTLILAGGAGIAFAAARLRANWRWWLAVPPAAVAIAFGAFVLWVFFTVEANGPTGGF
jgi:hypothetical protein